MDRHQQPDGHASRRIQPQVEKSDMYMWSSTNTCLPQYRQSVQVVAAFVGARQWRQSPADGRRAPRAYCDAVPEPPRDPCRGGVRRNQVAVTDKASLKLRRTRLPVTA